IANGCKKRDGAPGAKRSTPDRCRESEAEQRREREVYGAQQRQVRGSSASAEHIEEFVRCVRGVARAHVENGRSGREAPHIGDTERKGKQVLGQECADGQNQQDDEHGSAVENVTGRPRRRIAQALDAGASPWRYVGYLNANPFSVRAVG